MQNLFEKIWLWIKGWLRPSTSDAIFHSDPTSTMGYDENFLSVRVPLPSAPNDIADDFALTKNGKTHVLTYTHFSVAMSKSRRMARFTAVNIDGKKLVKITREKDKWSFDSRIDKKFQLGEALYDDNEFDRGHLVRRIDPVWGDQASKANDDTFHFTNSVPQHQKLNRGSWSDLEDYILKNADVHDKLVSVFTGPVFKDSDKSYRGAKIPEEFWKVVVIVKSNNQLSATAYLQTQRNLLGEREFEFGAFRTYQVKISEIEKLTRLDFNDLNRFDPLTRRRDLISSKEIESANDLVL
jgi:endonuclease G